MRISDWSSDVCSSDLSPIGDRPGYDYVIQAEGGLMAVTGEVDGEPMKVGVAVADLFTGMAAAQAILAALLARDRDGVGQIGSATCRERVWQSVLISGVAVSLKKKNNHNRSKPT